MQQIRLLYVTSLCSKTMGLKLLKLDPLSYGFQIQKYHRLLVKGFYKNGVIVEALSHPKNIEKLAPLERLNEQENGIHYSYLTKDRGGYLQLLWNSFSSVYRYLKLYQSSIVICDVLSFTCSFGAAIAARMLHKRIIGIITDFPEQITGKSDLNSKLIWCLVGLCTGYIVLTEQMKERLSRIKPIIVLEGHVDSDMSQVENILENKYGKKICLYAGALHKKYGVEKLVKAFLIANVENSELHLYGNGDYVEELSALQNDRVRYFGSVPNSVIVEEELKATLLVNPRPTDAEFTKYSFPSKNMEYMVSGTPLLTTRLPGMPKEYDSHVFFFEDESVEGMSRTLREVLSKTPTELHQKGILAKEYIMKNKTEALQAKKILDFFG